MEEHGKNNRKSENIKNIDGVVSVIPKYAPNMPPKNYNKKKAISIFGCIKYSYGFKCPELIRARISTKGDIYVVPYPITEIGIKDFHLSHHNSGDFHWTDDGNHVQPIYGEKDLTAVFKLWLKFRYPTCFCFRKGKSLDDIEIDRILRIITQYLPFTVNQSEAYKALKDSKFYRLLLSELKRSNLIDHQTI